MKQSKAKVQDDDDDGPYPIEVVKKKLSDDGCTILYKIKWSNQSITFEPLNDPRKNCLGLINQYEMKLISGVAKQEKEKEKEKKQAPMLAETKKLENNLKNNALKMMEKLVNKNESIIGKFDSFSNKKEKDVQKEKEKFREKLQKEQEKERERVKEREAQKEKEKERERIYEKEKEKEKEKERQLELQKEKLRLKEKELEREREKAREKERLKQKEREFDKQFEEKLRQKKESKKPMPNRVVKSASHVPNKAPEPFEDQDEQSQQPEDVPPPEDKSTDGIIEKQQEVVEPQRVIQHQPKESEEVKIIAVKRASNQQKIFFLIQNKLSGEHWCSYEELRQKSPVHLCSYLLDKIKWNTGQQ